MCYVHNQWYDISCATLYSLYVFLSGHVVQSRCNYNGIFRRLSCVLMVIYFTYIKFIFLILSF